MKKATILLVEDNQDDVELTLHAFDRHELPHQVAVARDGQEAMDYLFGAGSVPDLVLLDLNLPRIGGMDVLRAMRDDPRTKRVPAVILTTSDDEVDISDGYELGINSYIRKPVDFDKFTATVKQLGMYWLALNTPPPKPI